ncbi:hypothetical protein [Campylobacter majalis]
MVNLIGASRLLLHADEISFEFKGEKFQIKSVVDVRMEFVKLANGL